MVPCMLWKTISKCILWNIKPRLEMIVHLWNASTPQAEAGECKASLGYRLIIHWMLLSIVKIPLNWFCNHNLHIYIFITTKISFCYFLLQSSITFFVVLVDTPYQAHDDLCTSSLVRSTHHSKDGSQKMRGTTDKYNFLGNFPSEFLPSLTPCSTPYSWTYQWGNHPKTINPYNLIQFNTKDIWEIFYT